MAYIMKDEDFDLEESEMSDGKVNVPPSFLTSRDSDPYLQQNLSVYPDARRNILSELNCIDATMLPPPPEKDCLEVYLRVKPKTAHEKEVAKEQSGSTESEDENFLKVESKHQVAITAPKDNKAYKNCAGGVGKIIHKFSFTKIFEPNVGQSDVYETTVLPRLKDFLEGQNQLLFTYGATSSGKTYTIQGSGNDPGIMPRALATVFSSIGDKVTDSIPIKPIGFRGVTRLSEGELEQLKQEKHELFKHGAQLFKNKKPAMLKSCSQSSINTNSTGCSSIISGSDFFSSNNMEHVMELLKNATDETNRLSIPDEGITYGVFVSFMEIYNENVYDLFENIVDAHKKLKKKAPNERAPAAAALARKTLRLFDDRDGATYCKDLIEIPVSSASEAFQALIIGRENLHFATTKLNKNSSRSHCIFTIKVIRVSDAVDPQHARTSILSFCDLAGSERISKTQNVGNRQKEAGSINTSLLVLGRCIKAIRNNQTIDDPRRHEMIPFREAKLTRLFKTYFTGLGKATLIVCISQAQYLFEESVHVLKFASIANKITIEQKPVAQLPPIQKRRTSRFSSMLEGVQRGMMSSTMLSGHSTIKWEVPPARSTMIPPPRPSGGIGGIALPNFAVRQSVLPANRADLSEVSEQNEDESETTIVHSEQFNALFDIIEELKQNLAEERKKSRTIESEVRKELCQEFNAMMVQMNKDWNKRLEDERTSVKAYHDWRVNAVEKLYKEHYEKKEENSSSASSTEVENLRRQNEEIQEQLANAKKEANEREKVLAAVRDALKSREEEMSQIQEQKNELKSLLEEQEKLSANLGRELVSVREHLEKEKKLTQDRLSGDESEISQLKTQISELMKDQLKKDEEIQDKNELLQEAGDEFLAKENELMELQTMNKNLENQITEKNLLVADIQGQLEESHLLLREAYNQVEERETRIVDLEEACETKDFRIAELEAVEKELETTKKEAEANSANNDGQEEQIKSLQKKVKGLEDEKERLEKGLNDELESQRKSNKSMRLQMESLAEEKESMSSSLRQLKEELESKTSELEKSKEALAELRMTASTSDQKMQNLMADQQELEALKASLAQAQEQVDRLRESSSELSDKHSKLERELESKVEALAGNEQELATLRKQHEASVEKREAERAEEKERRERMERDFEAKVEALAGKEQELTTLRQRLDASVEKREVEHAEEKEWRERMRVEKTKLEERVNECARATKMLAEKEEEFSALHEKSKALTAELKEKQAALDQKQRQLDEFTVELNGKGEALTQKEKELENCSRELETKKTDFELKENELKDCHDQLNRERKVLTQKEAELEKCTKELEALKRTNEGMSALEQELSELKESMKLSSQRHTAEEVQEMINKLYKVEEENAGLKSEISKLEKWMEEKRAAHERELKRLVKANELIISEYKETNANLQKQAGTSSTDVSPSESKISITVTEASTIDADDDKSDASWLDITPAVKRTVRGRGRAGGRTRKGVSRNSSLASFEDSNVENDPEPTRNKVGRKPRVARNSVSSNRKNKKETPSLESQSKDDSLTRRRILKESQLTPVEEGALKKHNRSGSFKREDSFNSKNGSDSDMTTPAVSRKRKLYSMTPQINEVFTPPTDTEAADSPHSIVKRQLRARSSRKKF